MKITQYGHGICSANGEACDCVTAGWRLGDRGARPIGGSDASERFLSWTKRVLWVGDSSKAFLQKPCQG